MSGGRRPDRPDFVALAQIPASLWAETVLAALDECERIEQTLQPAGIATPAIVTHRADTCRRIIRTAQAVNNARRDN